MIPSQEDRIAAIFADPDAVEMSALLATCVDTWTQLAALVEEASEIQFAPAPIPRPVEDTTERASGGHSDPTWSTVQDARRADVRAFVLEALRTGRSLHIRGERAIDRWTGAA